MKAVLLRESLVLPEGQKADWNIVLAIGRQGYIRMTQAKPLLRGRSEAGLVDYLEAKLV